MTGTSAPWFIYLIHTRLDTLYTGVTTDVERRFREHTEGKQKAARYLKSKGPLRLVYQAEIGDKSVALRCEYHLKKLKRNDKLSIIEQQLDGPALLRRLKLNNTEDE